MAVTEKPLYYLSIHEAQQLIKDKKLSPVELTRAVLDRIEKVDGRLHAFINLMADSALAEARNAGHLEISAHAGLPRLRGNRAACGARGTAIRAKLDLPGDAETLGRRPGESRTVEPGRLVGRGRDAVHGASQSPGRRFRVDGGEGGGFGSLRGRFFHGGRTAGGTGAGRSGWIASVGREETH